MELVRELGLADCILLVLGAIIGSGIFLTPGGIARTTQSTAAVFFVWILGGVLTFCGALSYAELGPPIPGRAAFMCFSGKRTGGPRRFFSAGASFSSWSLARSPRWPPHLRST